jgi:hypothetical protein
VLMPALHGLSRAKEALSVGLLLIHHPLHDTSAYPERARDPQNAHSLPSKDPYTRFHSRLDWRAAQLRPLGPRPCQACVDPLPDHSAFELGEHSAHLEHGAAGRSSGVESLLVKVQIAAQGL